MNNKRLQLNKETIAKLEQSKIFGGGIVGETGTGTGGVNVSATIGSECVPVPASDKPSCAFTCDTPDNHCDFPTINDSCFSWCNGKCNDF